MISVTINGSETELDGPTGLNAYLESKDLAERKVAVAVNGVIVGGPSTIRSSSRRVIGWR
jgi:thiamine biosynthesis protein ThiS